MKTLSLQVPVSRAFRVVYLDDDDYERVRLLRWRFVWHGRKLYPAISVKGEDGRDHQILMSHFIVGLPLGCGERIRHANKNRLDLQRRNLIFPSRTADFAPGYPDFSLHIPKWGKRKRKRYDAGPNPAPEFSKLEDYK